jgi:hypothetical protein
MGHKTDSENLRAATTRYAQHNDSIESTSARSARVRRDILRAARASLQASKESPELKRLLGVILDELEAIGAP